MKSKIVTGITVLAPGVFVLNLKPRDAHPPASQQSVASMKHFDPSEKQWIESEAEKEYDISSDQPFGQTTDVSENTIF